MKLHFSKLSGKGLNFEANFRVRDVLSQVQELQVPDNLLLSPFPGGRTKIIESEELKARLSEQGGRLTTESLQHNRDLNMDGRNSSLLVAEMELRASGIELGSNAAASICSCLPAVLQQQVPPANSPSQGTSPVSMMNPSIVSNASLNSNSFRRSLDVHNLNVINSRGFNIPNASLKSNSFRRSLDVHNLNVISSRGFNILRSSLDSSSRGSVTASNNIVSRTSQSTTTLDLSKVVKSIKRTVVRSSHVQGLPARTSSHSSSSLVASATSGGGEATRDEAQPLTLHYSPMSPTSSRCIIKTGASSQGITPHFSTPVHTYSASSSASSELPRLSSHYHNAFSSSYSNSVGQKYSLSEPLPQLSQLISSDKSTTPSSPTDAIITSNQQTCLQNSALPLLLTERNRNLHDHGLEWDYSPFEGSAALLGSYPECDHNMMVKEPFNQTLQTALSDGSELSDVAHSSRDYETTPLQSEQQGQYACGSPSSSQTGINPKPSKSTQICVEVRPRPLDDGELQAVKYQSSAATYRRFSVEIPQQMQVIQVDQQRHSSVKMQQQIKVVVQKHRTLHKSYSNPLLPRAISLGQDPSPHPQSAVQHFSSTTAHPIATSSYSNAACPSKCVKGKPFFHSQSFGSWNLTNIARGKVKMSQQLNRGSTDVAEAEVLRAGGNQLAAMCSSATTREQCALLQPSSIITTWKDHTVILEDSVGIHLKRAAASLEGDDSNATPSVTASFQIGSTITKDEMLVQAAASQQLSRRLSLSRLRRSSVVIDSMSTEAGKGEGLEGLPDAVNEMTEYSSCKSPSEPPGLRNSSSSLMITSFRILPGSPGVEAAAEDVVPGLYTYPTEPSFPPATSAVAVATNKRYQASVEVAVDSSAGGDPLFDTPKLIYSHAEPLVIRESRRQLVKTVVVTEAEACAGPTAMPIASNNIDQAAGFESSSSRNHLENAERGLDDEHFKMMNNDGNAAAAGKQPLRTDATTEHTIHTAASLLDEGSSSDRIPSSHIGKIDSCKQLCVCNPALCVHEPLRSMSLLKLRLKSNKDEVPEYCSLPPTQLMSHKLEVKPQVHLRSLEYLVLGSPSTEMVATSHKVEQLDLLASSSEDIQQPTGMACNPPHKEYLSQLRDHEESMSSAARSAASSLLDQQPSLLVEPSFINYSSSYNQNPELSALALIQVRSESDSADSMARAVYCDELSSLGTTVTLYCSRLPH
ncbi:hypothetical protein CEUSTIGMA_g6395.t1 [Chlamydomonas eustigma]|uniref:Uncharacterized protein n=1 Tax=Chlamydomonas eustigma TaxID=1157962 RepID=A0A250X7B6_9CHLO|nr:hypothetical protein CEUSTIGMA_g6395.t1 [Chlamydomonas eustigma]|eukprot:GAX78955.1 hypothetical protein CEUSTIGMA_g6395.t1 [Chlamydomonas eustigma]